MSVRHTADRPTVATIGAVLLCAVAAVAVSGWWLGALSAAGLGVLTGCVLGGAALTHRRWVPISTAASAVAVSLGALGVVAAVGTSSLAAYNSFGTRSVAAPALLARMSTFLAFTVGATAVGAGLAALGHTGTDRAHQRSASRSDDQSARSVPLLALGVLSVYTVVSVWLLWDFLLFNAAAVGIDQTGLLSRGLLASGATGPHVGPLLVLIVAAGTSLYLALDRLSVKTQVRRVVGQQRAETVERCTRLARWTAIGAAIVALPAGVVDTIGAWPSSVGGVPVEALLGALSTSALLRVFLLAVTAVALVLLGVRAIAGADWRRFGAPVAVLIGAAAGPLVLLVLVEHTDVVGAVIDRAPPDAAQSIQLLVDELGALAFFVSVSAVGAAVVAVVALVCAFGSTLDLDVPRSVEPALVGGGGLTCGVAAVAFGGLSTAGLIAVSAGFLAWWLGAFGQGIVDAIDPQRPTTIEFVHAGASVLAVGTGAVVVGSIGFAVDLTATGPGIEGVGTLLALGGIALLVLSIR